MKKSTILKEIKEMRLPTKKIRNCLFKKSLQGLNRFYRTLFLGAGALLQARLAFADALIPISSDDETTEGSNIAATFFKIVQKDILPLAELGGACYLLYVCLGGIWKGYQEYQREKDMAPLKHAVMASTLAIVIGGSILFLLDKCRSYQFD